MTALSGILIFGISLSIAGCAYRLQPPMPPFQQRLRIVAPAPQQYTVRVQSKDYSVPPEGRVDVKVGGLGRGCSVYLFDRIPIRRVPSPTKEKIISIMNGTAQIQAFSLHDLARLPHDSEDVPQIAIPVVRSKSRPARSN
jgi:hypothetical protein